MENEATLKFRCPACQQKLRVGVSLIGRRVKCPRCGGAPVVPAQGMPDGSPKAPAERAVPPPPPAAGAPPVAVILDAGAPAPPKSPPPLPPRPPAPH